MIGLGRMGVNMARPSAERRCARGRTKSARCAMQLGMIGLGRMGANMVRRLMHGGHQCVVFDLNPDNVGQLAKEGALGATSMQDFVAKLNEPRAVWIMVPAGAPTESTVGALAKLLEAGDIIIDG